MSLFFVRPALSEEITIRAYSSLPDAAIAYLARSTAPMKVIVKPPETVETTIRATCGYWNDAFYNVLTELDPHAARAQSGEISMPGCVFAKRNAIVKIRVGDTLDTVLRRETGALPELPLPCGRSEVSPRCNKPLKSLVADLNPGRDLDHLEPNSSIVIPYQTRPQTFKLRPDISSDHVGDVLSQFRFLAEKTVLANLSPSTNLVRALAADDIRNEKCKFASQQATAPWPFDIETVASILRRNLAIVRRRSGEVRPSVVAILDTGILFKGDFFPNRYFAANFNEEEGGPAVDHDGNGAMNDVFGINMMMQGDISAYAGDPRREHGSQVANLVLGGRPFRSVYKTLEQLIQIKVVRMVTPYDDGQYSIAESGIATGLKYANRVNATVANISVGTSRKISSILDILRFPPGILAVVAAGNEGEALGDIPLYPANFGGTSGAGRDNVITVAAHDSDGKLAEFSNHGKDYVDIAAPGCDLLFRDGSEPLYGTSFAAPLVSFTAAILRSFGLRVDNTGPSVKQRLEASVDYDQALSDDIAFSGRLNVSKALSLYDDVMEVRDGSKSRMAFGLWRPSDSTSVELCSDGNRTDFKTGAIRKITNVSATKIRVLYENDAGVLDHVFCTPLGPGLFFKEQSSLEATLLAWSAFRDFVPGVFVRR